MDYMDTDQQESAMTDTASIKIGQQYVVTDAAVSPHHFPPGTKVRVVRDNADAKRGLSAHRWECRGKRNGDSIVQWLAAEDLAPAVCGDHDRPMPCIECA